MFEPMTSARTFADRLKKSRSALLVLVALLGTGAGLALSLLSLATTLEHKTLDLRSLQGARPDHADSSVLLIAVDQNSLDFLERHWGMKWPWPREYYALMLDYLEQGKPRLVAFDYDFSQRDEDRLEVDGVESDRLFAEAIGRAGNVVLGVNLTVQEEGDQPGGTIMDRHTFALPPLTGRLPAFDKAVAPLPEFQRAAAALGATNFSTDDDGIARRSPLIFRYHESGVPQFAAACFAVARRIPAADRTTSISALPVEDDGSYLISWYGRGGPAGVFRYISIHALLVSAVKMRQGMTPDLSPQLFADKCLVVGGSAAGLWDFKPTPFTAIEQYPGMEIQATLLSNLLNGHTIHRPPVWVAAVLTLALSLLAAWIFFTVHRVVWSSVLIFLVGAAFTALAFALFDWWSTWLPLITPLSGLVVTYALAAVFSYAVEGQQKRVLRRAFNRYFSPHVVADILDNAEQVELGGKAIEATVFFSDIKDFTSVAERSSPQELVFFLNEYFSLASDVILHNEAMLDKYIGDAIMAVFGAPIPRPDHARVACLTALEIQAALADHHSRPDRDPRMPIFETRIGLHTGNILVGNIGSKSRLDYTAIGDTVNVASRLEGVNKVFGTHIIISEPTYEQAGDAIAARPLDFLRVKGKAIPIRIYELVGKNGAIPEALAAKITMFEEGLRLYRNREFQRAGKHFEEILAQHPDDIPSVTYIHRCEELQHHPLPDDWDGVYTLMTK